MPLPYIFFVDFLFLAILLLLGIGFTSESGRFFEKIFLSIFFGTLFLTIIFSLIYTKGNTIFSVILISYLTFCQLFKTHLPKFRYDYSFLRSWKLWCYLLLALAAAVSFQFAFYSLNYGWIVPYFSDYQFYSKLVYSLTNTGIETTSGSGTSPTPYHYFDLWLASIIGKYFGLSPLQSLLSGATPVLIVILLTGYAAIGERFTTNKKKAFQISLLMFFVVGIFFDYYKLFAFFNFEENCIYTPLKQSKLIIAYILFTLFALLLLKGEKKALWVFISVPFFYVSFLPTIFTAAVIIGLYPLFPLLNTTAFKDRNITLFVGVPPLLFFLFYYLNGMDSSANLNHASDMDILNIISLNNLKLMLTNSIGSMLLPLLLSYLPIYLMLSKFNVTSLLKKATSVHFIFLCLPIFGSMYFYLFSEVLDSKQFFSNLIGPCFSVSILLFFYEIEGHKDAISLGILLALSANGIFSTYKDFSKSYKSVEGKYDPEFLSKFRDVVKMNGEIGAYLRDVDEFKTTTLYYTTNVFTLDLELQTIRPPFGINSLSIQYIRAPLDSNHLLFNSELKRLALDRFNMYASKFPPPLTLLDTCNIQKQFIVANDLKYLLLDSSATLPPCLAPLFDKVSVDNQSGIRLYY